jgi:exo-rhamnogalacturonan lyase-like protein/beta-L-arabinofuranosidase (glycosyl hydrolase family 127)
MTTRAIAMGLATLLLVISVARGGTVPITVTEPCGVDRQSWPVTSGVPFAQGSLKSADAVALFADGGKEVPLQTEALALWPDGSVRWLLLDFQTDLKGHERRTFQLRYGSDVTRSAVAEPVTVQHEPESALIQTGPLELRLDLTQPCLLGRVTVDGKLVLDNADSGIAIMDSSGREYRLGRPESAVVEAAGPMRASLRLEGKHVSREGTLFRYVIRLHAYRGKPYVRCYYTFINDHQKSLMTSLKKLEVYATRHAAQAKESWHVLDGKIQSTDGQSLLFQTDENHYALNAKLAGERARGWVACGGDGVAAAVGIREFWQNWPKSLSVHANSQRIGICPELPPDLYAGKPLEGENKLYYHIRDGLHTFKVGVAKTHELWFNFSGKQFEARDLDSFYQAVEEPLLATCAPEYACATSAAGELQAADRDKYFGYDAWLDRALDAHLARRDKVREYGMLNYGDWFGERSVNWGNLEYDFAHGLFLQYLRSGDRRYFSRAEQAARHHIDVDVVHATNPHLKNPWGAAPQVGEIWLHCLNHTGGYYEDAPLPVSRTYQMGHSTNFGHVWLSGDLDYYYLTGDRRAREVALQMADAMVRHMPTSYGTHIRALGWPMIMVLHAYEATGDKKYLDAATLNWEVLKKEIDWEKGWVVRLAKGHCLHEERTCYGNVPFMEGLTLCALTRYHRATDDPEVLKAITVGIDQMIRECWQEDVKTFRYTACPLSSKAPYSLFMLSAEAMAYEAKLTGNAEHLRILREGFEAAIPDGSGYEFGKGAAQMIHFSPHGMGMLGE